MILSREIWLLDFKTDAVTNSGLTGKTADYAPQLKLYAQALERIYQRPATEVWLHFLSARETVRIELAALKAK